MGGTDRRKQAFLAAVLLPTCVTVIAGVKFDNETYADDYP